MPIGEFRPRANWENDRQFFYKYMSFDTATIVLKNRTLRWSTPAQLNDPFDVRFDLDIENSSEVRSDTLNRLWDMHYGEAPPPPGNPLGYAIRLLRGVFPRLSREEFDREYSEAADEALASMRANLPRFRSEIGELMKTNKLLCLSESPEITLMWSHYAEGHRGACFEFQSVPEIDSAWGAARKVDYVDRLPLLADAKTIAQVLSGQATLDARSIRDRLIYSKSTEWKYEREWRVCSGDGRDKTAPHEDCGFNRAELSSVIVGCEMTNDHVEAIAKLVSENYPGTVLKFAQKRSGQFGIDIVNQDVR